MLSKLPPNTTAAAARILRLDPPDGIVLGGLVDSRKAES
jgi:hypothetical protein